MTVIKSFPLAALLSDDVVHCALLDRGDWVLLGSPVTLNDGSIQQVYGLVDGDTDHKTTLRVGVFPPSKEGAAYNISAKLHTWSRYENSATYTDAWKPFTITLATSDASGGGVFDPAGYVKLVQAIVSVFIPKAITDDVPDPAAVEVLQFGVPDILFVAT